MNETIKLIKNRNSCRSFKNENIKQKDINIILDTVSNSASGANMQPFNIYSVSGDKLTQLGETIINHIKNGGNYEQDIQYYPINWVSEFKKRRMKTGSDLYSFLNIDRKDKDKRMEQWFDNFRWFGSQNVFFVTIDKRMIEDSQGMLIDSGILLQNIIMSSESLGYKTCPQGSTTEYGKIVKKVLDIPDTEALLYSIVIGIPNNDNINNFKPSKINYKDTAKHIQ